MFQGLTEAFQVPGTFEDGHVNDSSDFRHLILGRGCGRILLVAASSAESGRRPGGGGDTANQGEEQQQPETPRQHGCLNLKEGKKRNK